jgi:hypothetical protein
LGEHEILPTFALCNNPEGMKFFIYGREEKIKITGWYTNL